MKKFIKTYKIVYFPDHILQHINYVPGGQDAESIHYKPLDKLFMESLRNAFFFTSPPRFTSRGILPEVEEWNSYRRPFLKRELARTFQLHEIARNEMMPFPHPTEWNYRGRQCPHQPCPSYLTQRPLKSRGTTTRTQLCVSAASFPVFFFFFFWYALLATGTIFPSISP